MAVSGIRLLGLIHSWRSMQELKKSSDPAGPALEKRLRQILARFPVARQQSGTRVLRSHVLNDEYGGRKIGWQLTDKGI